MKEELYVKKGNTFYKAYTALQMAKKRGIQSHTLSSYMARKQLPAGLKVIKVSRQVVLYYEDN